MFDFFKKEKDDINILQINNPLNGEIIKIEDVPDPVFSQKMIGEGFAVKPIDGKVHSPVDGEIVLLPEGLHAVAIKTVEGIEILIHIGMDTFKLKGDGFISYVKLTDRVKKGDIILEFDIELINEKIEKKEIPTLITPVVITNPDRLDKIKINYNAKQDEKALEAEIMY